MRKWFILVAVLVVLPGAALVVFRPHSVRCVVYLKNATGMVVNVTVRRVRPDPTVMDTRLAVGGGRSVTYRYSEEETAHAADHLISVAVDTVNGTLLATGEFRGTDVYGKVLQLRTDGIDVLDR